MNTDLKSPYVFKYEKPAVEQPRSTVWLCRTDRLLADVQVLNKGGESRLHSHSHLDGFWMVLSGRIRFYGDNDELIGEYGPNEGVLVPRGVRYWFECVEPGPVEIMQVEVSDISMGSMDEVRADRQDVAAAATKTNS
jgi:mannose-6-phosphate isomerase-like protein (cupin superfamily)